MVEMPPPEHDELAPETVTVEVAGGVTAPAELPLGQVVAIEVTVAVLPAPWIVVVTTAVLLYPRDFVTVTV